MLPCVVFRLCCVVVAYCVALSLALVAPFVLRSLGFAVVLLSFFVALIRYPTPLCSSFCCPLATTARAASACMPPPGSDDVAVTSVVAKQSVFTLPWKSMVAFLVSSPGSDKASSLQALEGPSAGLAAQAPQQAQVPPRPAGERRTANGRHLPSNVHAVGKGVRTWRWGGWGLVAAA